MWIVDLLELLFWMSVIAFGVVLGAVVSGTRKD